MSAFGTGKQRYWLVSSMVFLAVVIGICGLVLMLARGRGGTLICDRSIRFGGVGCCAYNHSCWLLRNCCRILACWSMQASNFAPGRIPRYQHVKRSAAAQALSLGMPLWLLSQ
jgi:hypothetical protein